MNFTKAEKLAIVCVLVGMMNVDSDVDFREVALMESLITEFNLSRAEAA